MSKHDEFRTVVDTLKAASPTISAEQRIGLLRQAVQQHGLSVDEASEILEASGLIIGEKVNYFEILGLSIEDEALESQSETDIATHVDAAHQQRYNASLRAGGRIRPDGRTEEQWRVLLNHARDTLKDPEKRREHIVNLQRTTDDTSLAGEAPPIFKFPNGDEATDIPQLAALMAKNSEDAMNALYRGYLEQSLGRAGEMHFATAARAVVNEFPNDRNLGLNAMVQILQGKMEFQRGSEAQIPKQFGQAMEVQKQNEARTPKQLAHLIDLNWKQAKTLLYNGFIALWFEYTKQPQLANTAKTITSRYGDDQNVGLEMLVQELDPQIGQPELEMSHTHLDFGRVDTETQKTIQFKMKNVGRGFLYGDVQLASEMPGIQLSSSAIRGEAVVTVELDASHFAAKHTHETALIVKANSGNLKVPISCYVDHPIWKSIRRVLISGAVVAMIAFVPRLILSLYLSYLFADNRITHKIEWLGTRLTSTGFITELETAGYLGLLVAIVFVLLCTGGISTYRSLFFKQRILKRRRGRIVFILILLLIFYPVVLFIAGNTFTALDKLFYLGFDAPVVAVWAFWGFVIGAAIQGYREMKIYGQKGFGVLIAITPLLLLALVGAVKIRTDPLTDIKVNTKLAPSGTAIPENMVLIPAGEFEMGGNDSEPNESPVHTVYVDAFYMDRYEVTNAEYVAFLNAMELHAEGKKSAIKCYLDDKRIESVDGDIVGYWVAREYENHPVHGVTWYGAMAYAAWVGKRLPTEAEWEKAARGGLIGMTYPWGDTIQIDKANYNPNVNENVGQTTPIGSYPANGYGLYDMAGNVLEWCLDEYDSDFYANSPDKNPIAGGSITSIIKNFTKVKTKRVLRGGSCFDAPQFMQCASRFYGLPSGNFYRLGFRCVKAVPPSSED